MRYSCVAGDRVITNEFIAKYRILLTKMFLGKNTIIGLLFIRLLSTNWL